MRVGLELTIYGAGHQEWLLDLPRQGVFADIAKEIPNAKHFYLRPDVGGKDNLSIPMDLPLNDLRLYLADGYHVYAEEHPVDFWIEVGGGGGRPVCVAPGATMAEVLQQHCGASATIDADANYVFTSASVSLVQQLGMGTQASPLQIKDSQPQGTAGRRPSLWRILSKHASFDSLSSGLSSGLSSIAGALSRQRISGQRPKEPAPQP